MEAALRPPPILSFDGNIAENWKKWKQKFELYLLAARLDTKPENRQVAVLLHTIGEEALDKFNTFGLSDEDSKKLAKVIEAFERYCTPKANESVNRHIFFARTQQAGEPFDLFLTDLKKLNIPCGFGTLRDGLIKDRIISGLTDTNLKNRLLREDDLDMDKCIKICKAAELAQHQLKTLTVETNVHAVNTEKRAVQTNSKMKPQGRMQSRGRQSSNSQQATAMTPKTSQVDAGQRRNTKECSRCATRHPLYQCPGYGKTCAKCKKVNHFARACKSNRKSKIEQIVQNDNDSATEFFIGCINTKSRNEWNEQLILHNKKCLTVKLDTGAQCNVLPIYTYNNLKLSKSKIVKSDAKLTKYGGSPITVIGKCHLRCKTRKGIEANIEFQIVNEKAPAALGLPTLESLNLVRKVNIIENKKYMTKPKNDCIGFVQGSGLITDCEYDIKLKPNSVAHIEPCRRVPFKFLSKEREQLQKELKRMEKKQIIEKVHEPTQWVNALVIVMKKDGSLRICLDPHYLNLAIQRISSHPNIRGIMFENKWSYDF